MIISMTGFGRGEAKKGGAVISVELRSLNHRFLDIDVRLPKSLNGCEADVKSMIGARLSRGRISASLSLKGEKVLAPELFIDRGLAATYIKLLQELKQEFDLSGQIELQQLLNFPDIIASGNSGEVDDEVLALIETAVQAGIADLEAMRVREGQEIEKDLKFRVKKVDKLVRKIERRARTTSRELLQKLRDRVVVLADSESLDDGRLEMEVAILAEKADVTEECIRFKSHNTLFLELIERPNSEGRKLNFLLQEMHREANTIGAKANDAEISHLVVEIKEEVEKLREQVQNIE